jgi:hypothetical protein
VKRLHIALGVPGAVLAAFALSACSTMSPIQTAESYDPGDGVPATIGQVTARNLLIVSDEKNGPGTLSGSLLNQGDSPIDVRFQTQKESEAGGTPSVAIPLAGREQLQITEVTFPNVDAAPGEYTGIYMMTTAGKTLVSVPVLAPDGFYEDLRPAEATPAPTGTETEAEAEPAEPAPTEEATATTTP